MKTIEKKALLQLARDLSRDDGNIVAAIEAAIANPPRTTEEVGFYVSGDESDFENCFRKLCGLLEECDYGTSAEDKYCTEILEQWVGLGLIEELPAVVHQAIPEDGFGESDPDEERENLREHFPAAARAIEDAFVSIGAPLLSLDTGDGDTLLFINATSAAAERWRDVELGHDHQGCPLAVRSPMWHKFWEFIGYAGADDIGDAPDDLPGQRDPRRLSDLSFLKEV